MFSAADRIGIQLAGVERWCEMRRRMRERRREESRELSYFRNSEVRLAVLK